MSPGAGLLLFYVLPAVLVVSCVCAAIPWRRRRSRTVALLVLLLVCGAFVAWSVVDRFEWGAVVVAPAVAIAIMRLMLDGFSVLAERIEAREPEQC